MNAYVPSLVVALAYFVGSLSFAVIISRLMGLGDPRSYGSGNPGATNVLRSGNKVAAALTLLFDALKGAIPVALVLWLGEPHGLGEGTAALVGLAAFLGHLFPVFFGFQGGKGVATAAGVILALNPWLGGVCLLVWLAVATVWRYSSVAALVAAGAAPVVQMLVWGMGPTAGAILIMALLLIWRHRGNIEKLIKGQESKIGHRSGSSAIDPAALAQANKRHHAHAHGRPNDRKAHAHDQVGMPARHKHRRRHGKEH